MDIELRIKGTPSELAAVLEILGEQKEQVVPQTDTSVTTVWSYALKDIFWAKLSLGCKALIRKLSEQPNGYWDEQLKSELGVGTSSIGGSLSSIGLNMRGPLFKDKGLTWPVRREHREDTDRWMYILEPEWQEFVSAFPD